jgi:hypothetical protein
MKEILIGALSAIGAALAIFFYGKNAGKNNQKAKQTEEQLDELEKANKSAFIANNRPSSDRKQRMLDRNKEQ